MQRQELVTIQYLRAVAAIGVVVFHIGEIFDHTYTFGGSGVDMFFVISGFIMWMVSSPALYVVTIFAAISGGVATYVVVEKPMGRVLSTLLSLNTKRLCVSP